MSMNQILGTIYLIVALFPLTLALLVNRNKEKTVMNQMLFVIYLLLVEWVLCSAFKYYSQSESVILFWQDMRYIGIALIPVFLFLCSLQYSRLKLPIKQRSYCLFFIIPIITVFLVLTNQFHGLFRKSSLLSSDPIITVFTINGFWYWVHTYYSYFLIIATVNIILVEFIRQPRIYRRKPGIILAGIILPTLFNFLYDSGLVHPKLPVEMAPLTFILSMLFVYYAFYIYKPKDVIPIARNLMIEKMDNPIILFDNSDLTLDMNQAAEFLLNIPRRKVMRRSIEAYPSEWKSILSINEANEMNDTVVSVQDGERVQYFKYNQLILRDKQDKFIGRLIVLNDISKLQETMLRLEYLSLYDQLTGLHNRIYYERQLKHLDHEEFYPLGIIMGDVNGLKLVNDAFGHGMGDLLLRKAADTIAANCTEEHTVARIGGDEFAILLPNTSEDEIVQLIDLIKRDCETIEELPSPLSVSFGFAIKTDKSQSMNSIQSQADELMYKQKMLESRSVRSAMIGTLLQALAERNIETEAHLERTREQAVALGKCVNLPEYLLDDLSLLALLHDVGKLGIPDQILLKPKKLNEKEWEIMKQHSQKGYSIASAIPELMSIAEAILYHHERWDGTGYPHGLAGPNIPLLSRVISIVDAFDVMTHGRHYQKAISVSEALEEIKRCSGTQFDPMIAQIFIDMKQGERLAASKESFP